ncbi:MAG: hypothetical protein QXV17_04870 [Candidatus Micrarchaeaceae archaeon]
MKELLLCGHKVSVFSGIENPLAPEYDPSIVKAENEALLRFTINMAFTRDRYISVKPDSDFKKY